MRTFWTHPHQGLGSPIANPAPTITVDMFYPEIKQQVFKPAFFLPIEPISPIVPQQISTITVDSFYQLQPRMPVHKPHFQPITPYHPWVPEQSSPIIPVDSFYPVPTRPNVHKPYFQPIASAWSPTQPIPFDPLVTALYQIHPRLNAHKVYFQPIQSGSYPTQLQYLPVNIDRWQAYPFQLLSLKRIHIPILNLIPHGLPSIPGLVNSPRHTHPIVEPADVIRRSTPIVTLLSH